MDCYGVALSMMLFDLSLALGYRHFTIRVLCDEPFLFRAAFAFPKCNEFVFRTIDADDVFSVIKSDGTADNKSEFWHHSTVF
jgi:hypothetical protein